MKILKKIYLILAIILWIAAFILCFIYFSFSTIKPAIIIIAFIPAVLFSLTFNILKTNKKIYHALFILATVAVVTIWIVANIVWIYLLNYLTPVNDVAKYEAILQNDWQKGFMQPFVAHFPQKLPEQKENIRFFYRRPFLQGGGSIQLRMSQTKEEINNLYNKFIKKKMIFPDASDNSEKLKPTIYFMTGDTKNGELPPDFEIIFLAAISGNHGQNYGVAISRKRNEIVYFAEYW